MMGARMQVMRVRVMRVRVSLSPLRSCSLRSFFFQLQPVGQPLSGVGGI